MKATDSFSLRAYRGRRLFMVRCRCGRRTLKAYLIVHGCCRKCAGPNAPTDTWAQYRKDKADQEEYLRSLFLDAPAEDEALNEEN
jgi:hypothetical protein